MKTDHYLSSLNALKGDCFKESASSFSLWNISLDHLDIIAFFLNYLNYINIFSSILMHLVVANKKSYIIPFEHHLILRTEEDVEQNTEKKNKFWLISYHFEQARLTDMMCILKKPKLSTLIRVP